MKTKLQIIQEKRAEYTRKRRKKYLRAKHLRDNMPKSGRIIIDGNEFKRNKKGQRELDKYFASKKKPEATKAITEKLSWWRRLINFIWRKK